MNDTSAPPPGRPKARRARVKGPLSGEAKPLPGAGKGAAAGQSAPPGRPKAGQTRTMKPSGGEPKAPVRAGGTEDEGLGVRVSKLMAERGLCSRREADAYIERGLVFVDGEKVTQLGTRAAADAVITLAGAARAQQARQATILLHKPVGYVSGQAEDGYKPAVTLVSAASQHTGDEGPRFSPAHLRGLAPAGRLDIDSTGLLVLTQDGRVARQLIGDHSDIEKEYLVRVEGRLDAKGLALLNHGLSLDDRQLRPARVEWANEDQLRFILKEGRKRQIRRMCELVGLRVTGLKRVRIGHVRLGDLPLGKWRYLRPDEKF
jgi:23S rRNA pseudouridine2604 synthase